MNPNHRSTRMYWIAGATLLVVSAVGARWAMTSTGDNGTPSAKESLQNSPMGYICLGKVDVPSGVAELYPAQPGRVTFVIEEGSKVDEGDVLLRVDSSLAELRVKEAEADLNAAKEKLELAKFGVIENENKLELLEKAIKAAEKKKHMALQNWNLKKSLHKDGLLSDEELAVANDKHELAEINIAVEKKKKEALKKYNPQWMVKQAAANVQAKKAQWKKAQLGVDECMVKAPSDGLVLRVYSKPGEVLGPFPKSPAMEFCPDEPRIIRAEVLQEWAHLVKKDQSVIVEDDSRSSWHWKGTIKSMSDWFAHKRDIRLRPFMINDVLTLECIVEVDPKSGSAAPLRIGQRVKVKYY